MRRLILIRLGGGRVQSSSIPLEAAALITDIVGAIRETGGSPEEWQRLNLHFLVEGHGSTRLAVTGEEATAKFTDTLVETFCRDARSLRIGSKAAKLVTDHTKATAPWSYFEVTPANSNGPTVRFDHDYRTRYLATLEKETQSYEEFYARVIRVGGGKPTVQLEIHGHTGPSGRTFPVKNDTLARKLAASLYDTVKISGSAVWDAQWNLREFEILALDEGWSDVHLAEVIDEHGRLPVELTVGSVDELLASRQEMREWPKE